MNVLILEDDLLQMNLLKDILEGMNSNFVIKTANTVEEALHISSEIFIELFYLDIELRDGSGIDYAKKIREDEKYEFSCIVFISSFHRYALEAFKSTHCYDFIYKPYNKIQIENVTNKFLKSPFVKKQKKDFLIFSQNGISLKVHLDDIIFIESSGKDCIIHSIKGVYNIKRITLKKILSMINHDNFKQSHRSFIVNANYIKQIQVKDGVREIYFENYQDTALIGCTYTDAINLLLKN